MDAAQFYDLPEAGRLLWADSARLARQAATRAVPATRLEGAWRLPRAWVDAEAGIEPADADALKAFWLERLAPAAFTARRTVRSRARLPSERLLSADEAARVLFCDRTRLARLDADGTLPALVVDGAPRFDADLVAALAADDADSPDGTGVTQGCAHARRTLVLEWSHAEYSTAEATTTPTPTRPAPRPPPAEAPKAYALPDDLAAPPPPVPPTRDLSRAEGFETLDED